MKLYNKIFGNKGFLTDKDIEKYISGDANAKEQHNIEAKALQNELFADALDGYSKNKNFDIRELKNRTSKKLFKNNVTNYLIAIAAMLAFVTIIFFIPLNKKENNLAVNTTKIESSFEENKETFETVSEAPKVLENIEDKETENIAILEEVKGEVTKEIVTKTKSITTEKSTGYLAQNQERKKVKASTENNRKFEEQKNDIAQINSAEVTQTTVKSQDKLVDDFETETVSKKYSGKIELYDDEPVDAGNLLAEETKKVDKNKFEDNYHVIYLADNSYKIADYSGKRVPKEELKFDDARSIGISTRYRYENSKVAESKNIEDNTIEKEYFYNDFLEKGLFKLKKEEYSSAIEIFDVILEKYPDDINSEFYRGLSFYHLKKYSKAITDLNLVINDTINVFNQESEWYKALCLLETNKIEGKKLLNKIVKEAGIYSQKAIILLDNE